MKKMQNDIKNDIKFENVIITIYMCEYAALRFEH